MAATMTSNDHVRDSSDEKFDAKHLDEAGSQRSALSDDEEYSSQEQRKIIHRVDRRLVLTCGIMYCISLMDRTNLGQAAIAGMTKELKLSVGFRYVSLDSSAKMTILTLYRTLLYWSFSLPMSSFSLLPPSYAARSVLVRSCPSSHLPGEWLW
jgi:hypothetical protein